MVVCSFDNLHPYYCKPGCVHCGRLETPEHSAWDCAFCFYDAHHSIAIEALELAVLPALLPINPERKAA